MSKQQKAMARLASAPTDFDWNELRAVMHHCGFEMKTTGGSGRKFIHPETRAAHFIHEPHPSKVLKAYQVRDVVVFLTKQGYLQ